MNFVSLKKNIMKNYEKLEKFERNQAFKEYTQPIVNRQSALKTTLTLMTSHDLKWSMRDIMLVTQRLTEWMETGDESWVKRMDEYFKLKHDQLLEELLSEHTKKNIQIL